MSWTDERVATLKRFWADGLSAAQIAAQLGGVTRNAVIGKVHRLSLSGRAKPASSGPRPRKARTSSPHRPSSRGFISGNNALGNNQSRRVSADNAGRKTAAKMLAPRRPSAPIPFEDIVAPISFNVSLMALNDQMCKWPIGDSVAEFTFCGHHNWNSLPYCEYHSRVAYQPVGDRRRDRQTRPASP